MHSGNRGMVGYGKLLMALLVMALITGCAAQAPSTANMQADLQGYSLPQQPEEDQGLVYVVRPEMIGTLVRFNVFVDNQAPESEVGYTRGSQHIYFPVEPGQHTIFSKAENWASIDIDVAPGNTVFVRQHPKMGFVMARNNLSLMDELEGQYFVKETSLGTLETSE